MSSLINQAFQNAKSENRPALLTYTVAGDNTKKRSLEILKSISNYADICELGFPHNTPIADGGQIQTSAYRAIKNGIKINDVFSIAKDFKSKKKNKPIILMGYYNMIFQYNENKFLEKCKKSKVDGLIVVDLPYPENKKFASKCKKSKIDFIQLISPTTSKLRSKKTIKKLKQHTDREIIIRDKEKRHARVGANSVPWYLIKEGIYALVTYQSIAAIEAICTGVPAFTEELTAADSVACNDLSKIESPNYAPKEQVKEWQHWLAYCQYHFKEMQSGEAVRIMKEYGLM